MHMLYNYIYLYSIYIYTQYIYISKNALRLRYDLTKIWFSSAPSAQDYKYVHEARALLLRLREVGAPAAFFSGHPHEKWSFPWENPGKIRGIPCNWTNWLVKWWENQWTGEVLIPHGDPPWGCYDVPGMICFFWDLMGGSPYPFLWFSNGFQISNVMIPNGSKVNQSDIW